MASQADTKCLRNKRRWLSTGHLHSYRKSHPHCPKVSPKMELTTGGNRSPIGQFADDFRVASGLIPIDVWTKNGAKLAQKPIFNRCQLRRTNQNPNRTSKQWKHHGNLLFHGSTGDDVGRNIAWKSLKE